MIDSPALVHYDLNCVQIRLIAPTGATWPDRRAMMRPFTCVRSYDALALKVDPIPLAVRADTTDPVELWLIRLRPAARPRYLATLRAFLTYSGHSVESVIEAAQRDRYVIHEALKSFVASLPDSWTEHEFAYAAIRSFFSRCRIFLPTDPGYEVGGKKEQWWLEAHDR